MHLVSLFFISHFCFCISNPVWSRDYLSYTGVAHEDSCSPARSAILAEVSGLLSKLAGSAPVDAACDQLGKCLMTEVSCGLAELAILRRNLQSLKTCVDSEKGIVQLKTPLKL